MDRQKLIIDTDPGQDDAIAIMLALASPHIDLLGIIAAAGNVSVEQTAENACKILELAKRQDIKVYKGCPRPIRRPPITAQHVHGQTGMDGPDLPTPLHTPEQQHGVTFLLETLAAHPAHTITLVTIGPMTNLAAALVQAPETVARLKQVVAMGGAWSETGNITPAAEFNAFADPDAMAIVLNSGLPVTLVPLDITHRFLITPDRLEALAKLPGHCAKAAHAMLTFSARFDLNKYGWPGAPLHDPCTIGYVLCPHLFAGKTINVEVEVSSPLTLGATVVDWWQVTGRPPNATFLRSVDDNGLWTLILESLSRLP
ncbi:nucleoside hydrolase [Acetobacter tropicalis]|uniref:Inosine-uridine preferring nucleoside hydrolase n=1 Tax=Acetobacter tropicalis TaxID=104102 RepID=A0A094YWZ4_9PROT|nr:nucleoside hydrolase [Acetobacter tropicalis]KAA8390399.1 nucleoside hydrolase [Acetobacter tropicalis]KAA8391732.1 nucleoside hydrolase [Acetobacter tropicalis]KGB26515.1 Inosine-uridine preferring nucleoside hydrolase [Acetobacter tropicalis]MBC9009777.1 nucleoside hydrolase [Acetobacter tropicalis]MDO8173084.1 nucleoside hydrolase [Acetobacter tropicalis]